MISGYIIIAITAVSILVHWTPYCESFSNEYLLKVPVPTTTRILERKLSLLTLNAYDKSYGDWAKDTRIDVRNLLTQRSIQSFMFLCGEVRDPHSAKWIEDFLVANNLLEYHGTGASFMADVRWDAPLLEMLDQPKDHMIVSAKRRGNGHGGWSKNNPYLKDRFVEFKIDIDPASLTDRILAVREQIGREWVSDLAILGRANQQILDSYFQIAKEEREKLDSDLVTSPAVAFERTAANALNNHTAFGATGSPFRGGSFDLLYNLCTQASVHRLLHTLREMREDSHTEWLRNFYSERVADFFDGDLPYGRADDFIEELLLSSPSIIDSEDGTISLIDPHRLAEQIIETRNDIVLEWIEAMNQVPSDHQDGIRRILLNKRMSTSEQYQSGTSTGSEGFE